MRSNLNSMGTYYLPNFGISLLASGALLAILFVWIFLDVKFPYTLELGMIDLRWSPHPGFKQSIMDEAHAEVRWRLVFLGTISFLAASSTLWMLVRLFIGSSRGRSVSAMLLATALIAAWICLITQYGRLVDSGIKWRIKRQLPELTSLANRLKADWPTEDTEFPPYGLFRVDSETPEVLVTPQDEEQPFPD